MFSVFAFLICLAEDTVYTIRKHVKTVPNITNLCAIKNESGRKCMLTNDVDESVQEDQNLNELTLPSIDRGCDFWKI